MGAGPMGLAAAYQLLQDGHQVHVYEAAPVIGGMSTTFELAGTPIERFYHFICAHDQPMFDLLKELDLEDQLHWETTRMGFFLDGKLHEWGNPLALLRLPGLGPVPKLRYGIHAYLCTRWRHWRNLDQQEAVPWLRRWVGKRAYDRLWKPLLELKFHHHTEELSAAWIWNRIHRLGRSRKNLMQERLGYLEGGSATLLQALHEHIRAAGGHVLPGHPVDRVQVQDGTVRGVELNAGSYAHDAVISTVPLRRVPDMVPTLPQSDRSRIHALQSLAVACVVFKLKRPVSDKFWININDPSVDLPGIVEYTNLRPLDAHIVYAPYYLPAGHPTFQKDDNTLIERTWEHLRRINPALQTDDVIAAEVSRYRHAQPVCRPGHLDDLPPANSSIEGLYMADTAYYYPEDRGIAESVRLGRQLARMVDA
ncbi:NAD(P)/FAD-dependent oxidoreductase [Thioalkalivibrio sp. ALMg13-2]|uniref:NAD(P)/FAD-dependent oxidoreductase n=1 Tax=Thioalkalivibrio sp. ALMg13-2 TaxID=1158167 RepID=UPI002100B60E|nr:NAD(P)/FAD-dependent oxidoreductase [Thioalkalivibrio sp. ALMg13-2]